MEEERLRLAPHFPVVKEECKAVAAEFFFCYTAHAKMKNKTVRSFLTKLCQLSEFIRTQLETDRF